MADEKKLAYVTPAVRAGIIETNMLDDDVSVTVVYNQYRIQLWTRRIHSFISEHYRVNPIDFPLERPYPGTIQITVKENFYENPD